MITTIITIAIAILTPAPTGSATPDFILTPAIVAGDENNDGIIDEDEIGWNCETMGNQICGTVDNSLDECVNYAPGSLTIAICAKEW